MMLQFRAVEKFWLVFESITLHNQHDSEFMCEVIMGVPGTVVYLPNSRVKERHMPRRKN